MKQKILVTGGAGYIGSHVVVELLEKGYDVVIVDDFSNSSIAVLDGIKEITGIYPTLEKINCCDKHDMTNLFEKHKDFKAIIHFAASKAVGESVDKPLLYYNNNIVSLINILELMQQFNVANIVFSSSCTVYGQPDILPVTENAPVKPATSPYGNTKQIDEEIIRDTIHSDKNLKAIALRYFNPIGAHPSALIGELPNGIPNNLIPFVTQTAIGLRKQLSIFGNDYNTPDGTAIRDYIYVVDLAKAHVVAVKRLLQDQNKNPFEVFNIGTGRGLSVLEIVTEFEKATGVKVNYKVVGRREGDIEKVWANPAWANKELGWRAETSVDETLRTAWDWELHLAKLREMSK